MLGWLRRGRDARLRRLLDEGVAHDSQGRTAEAERAYHAALEVDPDNPYALFNLGRIDFLRGHAASARARLSRALVGRPGFAQARLLLAGVEEAMGNLCFAQGNLDDARRHFAQAAALRPELPGAHAGLGQVHAALGEPAEAAPCFRRALELDPQLTHAHVNLGNALASLGRTAEALASYDAALALDPENAAARWCRAISTIPAIRESVDETQRSRGAFAQAIAELDRWFDESRAGRGADVVGLRQPFWLAYQDERNTDLLHAYGQLCSRLMQARALPPSPPVSRPASGRLRVGVVSRQFRHHSVWHALMRGWFEHLDRDKFELLAFALGPDEDDETGFARSHATAFEQGPRGFEAWAEAIRTSRPDVLLYPEVGMDPMTVKLASVRLAPRQFATWGHPETTGLPTVDAFLSAELLEPPEAQGNYTETLIRLPHLGCHVRVDANLAVERPGIPGLEGSGPLLICPGTPFKYAPEHDVVLARIARELGRCRLVFFSHGLPELSRRVQGRLAAAFAAEGLNAAEYVRTLDWLERPQFLGLLSHAHAMLDTIGFSGFNTALMAAQRGLPIVTCEGRFLRGRLAAGILRRIGLDALIARDDADYADLAVRVCRDPDFHAAARTRLAGADRLAFGDVAPIRALEAVLLERAP